MPFQNQAILKKLLITTFLACLVLVSFAARLQSFHNFKKTHRVTSDENIYYALAAQLKDTRFTVYNSLPYVEEAQRRDKAVPEYLRAPLFKHPPLFPALIATSFHLFGNSGTSAVYVSILFGVLLIPLIYCLGTLVSNRKVALLSAFFLSIDPIFIICSQKIWMETTLAFFSVLSLYCFAYAVKRAKENYFILSGIAAGFAALTKYPGLLIIAAMIFYAALFAEGLFKRKKFILGMLVIPGLMLLPWGCRVLAVYGMEFIPRHIGSNLQDFKNSHDLATMIGYSAGLALLLLPGILHKKLLPSLSPSPHRRMTVAVLWSGFYLFFAHNHILQALQWNHVPVTSWKGGLFLDADILFYLEKLTEYSLIYAPAFLSWGMMTDRKEPLIHFTKFIAATLFLFYSLWGNFQSRYILSAIPLLLILGIHTGLAGFSFLQNHPHPLLKYAGRTSLIVLGIFILVRTYFIDRAIALPNDLCYF